MRDDDAGAPAAGGAAATGAAGAAEAASARAAALLGALWSIVGGTRPTGSAEPSDEAARRTLDGLQARAKGAAFYETHDPGECCMAGVRV